MFKISRAPKRAENGSTFSSVLFLKGQHKPETCFVSCVQSEVVAFLCFSSLMHRFLLPHASDLL